MTSTIYDLGYQRYTGKRLGRGHSFRTLWWFSTRAAFGVGRGEQARRAPVLVTALCVLPALIQTGIASVSGDMRYFISYGNYLEFIGVMVALFVAAQAPELIVTDKQNGALSLYLSRPISATDYALAKLAALATATGVIILAPQIVLFLGRVFIPPSPWVAFKEEWTKIFPIIGGTVLVSLFFAAVALALSAFAVKRAFASASVIAFFLLTPAFSTVVQAVAVGDLRRWSIMINPALLVSGFSRWLFELEARRRSGIARADLPGQAYMWVVIAVTIVATLVLLSRYRKNEV